MVVVDAGDRRAQSDLVVFGKVAQGDCRSGHLESTFQLDRRCPCVQNFKLTMRCTLKKNIYINYFKIYIYNQPQLGELTHLIESLS